MAAWKEENSSKSRVKTAKHMVEVAARDVSAFAALENVESEHVVKLLNAHDRFVEVDDAPYVRAPASDHLPLRVGT